MTFYEQAREKLAKDKITGSKAAAMAPAVKEALLNFAGQDEEFAQAIVQGGSFSACMAEVARGVGQAISDLEAFGKAAAFYVPGSKVRFEMHIDLIGEADALSVGSADSSPRGETKSGDGLVIDLSAFL